MSQQPRLLLPAGAAGHWNVMVARGTVAPIYYATLHLDERHIAAHVFASSARLDEQDECLCLDEQKIALGGHAATAQARRFVANAQRYIGGAA